jgi:hypothetical protein
MKSSPKSKSPKTIAQPVELRIALHVPIHPTKESLSEEVDGFAYNLELNLELDQDGYHSGEKGQPNYFRWFLILPVNTHQSVITAKTKLAIELMNYAYGYRKTLPTL